MDCNDDFRWEWQFPPCTKYVPTEERTRRDQALKIVEEAKEAMKSRNGYYDGEADADAE